MNKASYSFNDQSHHLFKYNNKITIVTADKTIQDLSTLNSTTSFEETIEMIKTEKEIETIM